MARFFVDLKLTLNQQLELPFNVYQHIKALRLQHEDEVVLFNGDGFDYKAHIAITHTNSISANIFDQNINTNESNLTINLIQCIPNENKFEFIIQKSTELGVNHIYPIISAKSNFKFNNQKNDNKLKRWQKIIISACEQSQRSHIPKIYPVKKINTFLENLPLSDKNFFFTPYGLKENHFAEENNLSTINILIGPEGGFSKEEEALLVKSYQFFPINLGKRILRSETAAIAAIAIVQHQFGDL